MISSLFHISSGSVFLVIQDPTNKMNKTAKHKNIPMEWLHNSTRLTWNVEGFFHKSRSKRNELNSPWMHKVPVACSIF